MGNHAGFFTGKTYMSFESAYSYLKERGCSDRVITFEVSTATVALAAEALHTEECRIAKTLGFLLSDGPILVVMAGDARADNRKYRNTFHEKAHMLSYEDAVEKIGHAPGGVCPFGVKEGVRIFLDVTLKKYDTVFPAVGSSNSAVRLTPDELESLLPDARWVDIAKDQ